MTSYSKTRWALAFATAAAAVGGAAAIAVGGVQYFSEYFHDQNKPLVTASSPEYEAKLSKAFQAEGSSCFVDIVEHKGKYLPTMAEKSSKEATTLKECYDSARGLVESYAVKPDKDYSQHDIRFQMNDAAGNKFYKGFCKFDKAPDSIRTSCILTGPTTRLAIASP